MGKYILEMRSITKTFPGVKALDDVNFKVQCGEIHCLVGENGAGKSTLMKVLSGIYSFGTYSGDIILNGEQQKFSCIKDSENAGIAIISQELALIPELSIYENIFFGHEIMKGHFVNWNQTIIEAEKILKRVKLDINPSVKVKSLKVGTQQIIEIAKTLSKNANLIILDEPTSSLNEEESKNLLQLLRELKNDGVTIIMISHRLAEVVSIADTITILRDGATICSLDASERKIPEQEIIKYMVGREIDNIYPERNHTISDDVCFEVKNWTVSDAKLGRRILNTINLKVNRGEIVGIAGLMGAGRTEFALSIFGNTPGYKLENGELFMNGNGLKLQNPMDALESGIAYVSEDRKRNGLILKQDIRFNITISNLKSLLRGRVINHKEEIIAANRYKDELGIKTPSVQQTVMNLSGGNQQKVSLAKLLFTEPKLLILDEPTRGIDVGAKFEIYSLMNRLVEQGMSIIMISSELPEIIGMSDRVYVMSNGHITGELSRDEVSEQSIMKFATTIKER